MGIPDASAQEPLPQPMGEARAAESQVFPGGRFPAFPQPTTQPAASVEAAADDPALQSTGSDYGPGYISDDYETALGPGELYRPLPDQLPEFYYEPEYYDASGIGVRPLADYAPDGYEARDYQSAPGVPEFSPLTPPPRPTAEGASRYVTRGIVPGSFLVPGTNTSFRLRGFVRLAGLYDFSPIGTTDAFATNSIPVPQQIGQNYNMSARISRFAIESWTPTSFHEWNVHTFIEGDFFNGPAQAAGGGGNPLRLRHAFVDFGYFRFGQQNSVFMDGNNWPSLVDFQGPNSWVNQRQPSVRMTVPVRHVRGLYWAASMERPFSDITTNALGAAVQDVPDFATHLRWERDRGHVQVSTNLRTIGFRPTGGDVTRQAATGVSYSAVVHPWAVLKGTNPVREANPSGLTRSRILMQYTWGPGLGRYVNDLAGQGLDGQVNPLTGELDLVRSTGFNASYEHWYCENWLSNFTFANVNVDNNPNQPGTSFDETKYFAASLWWIPVARMSLGLEYLWGRRTNLDGQDAEAQRLHGMFQYNF